MRPELQASGSASERAAQGVFNKDKQIDPWDEQVPGPLE
jgi:hypothetical protein